MTYLQLYHKLINARYNIRWVYKGSVLWIRMHTSSDIYPQTNVVLTMETEARMKLLYCMCASFGERFFTLTTYTSSVGFVVGADYFLICKNYFVVNINQNDFFLFAFQSLLVSFGVSLRFNNKKSWI